jgi:hypothetical protein
MRACLALVLLAAPATAAEKGAAPPTLGEPVELMKLGKEDLPAITFAQPFVQVSPTGERCVYIRMTRRGGKAMLMIRTFGPASKESPAPATVPVFPVCLGWGLSGRCWRADGLHVAYLVAASKDGMEGEDDRHRLGPAEFCWDLPVPQQSGGGSHKAAARSGTAVTYSASGEELWRAQSDLRKYSSARVVGRRGVVYEAKGVAIYGLTTSPDGRLLAWTEVAPHKRRARPFDRAAAEADARARLAGRRPRQGPARPALVVMDPKAKKVVHRVGLRQRPAGALVWAAGGKLLCFDDVAKINRVFRAEVKALDVAEGKVSPVVRDARPVGAVDGWLVANRGPACIPMRQHASSYMPPAAKDDRPRTNAIVLCDLAGGGEPRTLLTDAFAQQVVGRHLIYAYASGNDVLVMKAPLKAKAGKSSK